MIKLYKVLTSEIEGAKRSNKLTINTTRDHDSQGDAAEVASIAVAIADNIGRGIRAEDSNDSEHEYSDGDKQTPDGRRPDCREREG